MFPWKICKWMMHMKEIICELRIWNQMKNDPRSYDRNLYNCVKNHSRDVKKPFKCRDSKWSQNVNTIAICNRICTGGPGTKFVCAKICPDPCKRGLRDWKSIDLYEVRSETTLVFRIFEPLFRFVSWCAEFLANCFDSSRRHRVRLVDSPDRLFDPWDWLVDIHVPKASVSLIRWEHWNIVNK